MFIGFEISVCGNLLSAGMGSREAAEVFDAHRISEEEYKISPASIIKNENLVVRFQKKYLTWEKAAPVVLGMAAFGLDLPVEQSDFIRVERDEILKHGEDECALPSTPSGRRWRLWSLPFRRVKTLEHTSSNLTTEEVVANVEHAVSTPTSSVVIESPHKQLLRTNVPTSEEIASLNLKEGKNMVNFIFSAGVLGKPNEVCVFQKYECKFSFKSSSKIHFSSNRFRLIFTCGSGTQELLYQMLMEQLQSKA